LEWETLAQDRTGWLKLVTEAPFDIWKPQLRSSRCDRRALELHQRRSGGTWRSVPRRLNNGVLSSTQKQTQKWRKSGFKNISRTVSTLEGGGSIVLPALYSPTSLRFWLARNDRACTSARSTGLCAIWVCINSSSSSFLEGVNGFNSFQSSTYFRTEIVLPGQNFGL